MGSVSILGKLEFLEETSPHKVLITNLSNYIQPFIRYEVTDRIIVHGEPCGCGKASKKLKKFGDSNSFRKTETY